jgi:hypothetical protein
MYKTRIDIFKKLNKKSIICEIGIFRGDFSKQIYETLPKELHLVDVFCGSGYTGDKDGLNYIYTDDMNVFYEELKKLYKNDNTVKIIKNKSENYLKTIDDDYFDIIYIDGDHSYEGVSIDLELSRQKVKNNGYITGHDYHETIGGVKQAVDDFVKKYNLKLTLTMDDLLPSFIIENTK